MVCTNSVARILVGALLGGVLLPRIGQSAVCRIAVSNVLANPQPLLISMVGKRELLLPTDPSGIILLRGGDQLEIFCSRRFQRPAINVTNSIIASCFNGTQFRVGADLHEINAFQCSGQIEHSARRTGRSCTRDGGTLTEIGFPVGNGHGHDFLRLMTVCHNERTANTLWTNYVQRQANQGFERGFSRPAFMQGDFFPHKMNVNQLYTRVEQRRTIARILRSDTLATHYIHETNNLFLARGHVAAKVDFIFGAHQRATFWFINAAPQWQTFNAGNWERIENVVRTFIANRNFNADIYSGTFGTATLIDAYGRHRELFLDFDLNGNGLIRVPRFFYKVVIDPVHMAGIVFVGVNNPYLQRDDIMRNYILCNDVSGQLDWIQLNNDHLQRGYAYACDVRQFTQIVTDLPTLSINRLLL